MMRCDSPPSLPRRKEVHHGESTVVLADGKLLDDFEPALVASSGAGTPGPRDTGRSLGAERPGRPQQPRVAPPAPAHPPPSRRGTPHVARPDAGERGPGGGQQRSRV